MDMQFWTALVQIIGVNIILSGDNAVVIALACRSLPERQRRMGILLGAGAAVVLRVIFTVFIVYLLTVPYLKIVGGGLLFWVGYKLMTDESGEDDVAAGSNMWQAIRIILVADAVMSLDNVIAVAAAAQGNVTLLVIGLLISVPLVVYGATLLIQLIDRYPVIVPAGAALIGYIAGEVIVTDPAIEHELPHWVHELVPLLGAMGIVVVGRIVAPPPAGASLMGEAAGSAAVFGGRLAIQVLGRILITRAPMIVATIASALGYAVGESPPQPSDDAEGGSALLSVLYSLRPILAAVIAIAAGELVAAAVRRWRGTPAAEHRST
jgi:YjbE family integral membrane protein